MNSIKQSEYIDRLTKHLRELDKKRENLVNSSKEYKGSLGGQNTILTREIEYLKTHKIISDG